VSQAYISGEVVVILYIIPLSDYSAK